MAVAGVAATFLLPGMIGVVGMIVSGDSRRFSVLLVLFVCLPRMFIGGGGRRRGRSGSGCHCCLLSGVRLFFMRMLFMGVVLMCVICSKEKKGAGAASVGFGDGGGRATAGDGGGGGGAFWP